MVMLSISTSRTNMGTAKKSQNMNQSKDDRAAKIIENIVDSLKASHSLSRKDCDRVYICDGQISDAASGTGQSRDSEGKAGGNRANGV